MVQQAVNHLKIYKAIWDVAMANVTGIGLSGFLFSVVGLDRTGCNLLAGIHQRTVLELFIMILVRELVVFRIRTGYKTRNFMRFGIASRSLGMFDH